MAVADQPMTGNLRLERRGFLGRAALAVGDVLLATVNECQKNTRLLTIDAELVQLLAQERSVCAPQRFRRVCEVLLPRQRADRLALDEPLATWEPGSRK